MTSSHSHNPFQPPQAADLHVEADRADASPAWFRWGLVASGSSFAITACVLAVAGRNAGGVPVGIFIALLCAFGLMVQAVVAGLRYPLVRAVGLLQAMNFITWATMLTTVFLMLPVTIGDRLRLDEVLVFVWIWLGGVFVVAAFVGLGTVVRRLRVAVLKPVDSAYEATQLR